MSRVTTAAGRVAHGLVIGSCTSGLQQVLQGSLLLLLSVRQHAVQGLSEQQPMHSAAGAKPPG